MCQDNPILFDRYNGSCDAVQGTPLVQTTRGLFIENVHAGHVAVVNTAGKLLFSAGNPHIWTPVRSTAKAIQALPTVAAGVAEYFGLDEASLALMAASHQGTDEHIAVLEQMLTRTGISEQQLVFGPTAPSSVVACDCAVQRGVVSRKLHHVCAGKHLGMLALCTMRGWSLTGYEHKDHPLQQLLLQQIANVVRMQPEQLERAVDGCGLPVFAMPLERLAFMYARLVAPLSDWEDEALGKAAGRIAAAMNRWPTLVEGNERLASQLLEDDNVVAKSGAQGLFVLGLREEQCAIAIKVSDGTEIAWPYIVWSTLTQLGLARRTAERIRERYPQQFVNDCGQVVGLRQPVFTLKNES